MLHFILSRPTTAKLTMAVVMATPIVSSTACAQTDANPARPVPAPAPPPPSALPVVQRALREFDRFLDHHPVLEDQLRLDAGLVASSAFLEKSPELRDFLKANVNVAEGLKVYPRYFLNRALLRQASAPLTFKELAPFKDLFQREPGLERELIENPELIRDPAFLQSHAALHALFVEQPALARVFLPTTVSPPQP